MKARDLVAQQLRQIQCLPQSPLQANSYGRTSFSHFKTDCPKEAALSISSTGGDAATLARRERRCVLAYDLTRVYHSYGKAF
jgi:hypothetical protein